MRINLKKRVVFWTALLCFLIAGNHEARALSFGEVEDAMDKVLNQRVCYKAVAENVVKLANIALSCNEEASGLVSKGTVLTNVTMSICEKGVTAEALEPLVDMLYDHITGEMLEGVVIENAVKGLGGAVSVPIQLQLFYFKYALDYARSQDVQWMLEEFLKRACGNYRTERLRISDFMGVLKLDVVAGAILQSESKFKFYKMSGTEIKRKRNEIKNKIVITFLSKYNELVKKATDQRKMAGDKLTTDLKALDAKLYLAKLDFEKEFEKNFEALPYFKMLRKKGEPTEAEAVKHNARKWFVLWHVSDRNKEKRIEAKNQYHNILRHIRNKNGSMTEAQKKLAEADVEKETADLAAFEVGRHTDTTNDSTPGESEGGAASNRLLEVVLDQAEEGENESGYQKEMKDAQKSSFTQEEIQKISTEGRTVPASFRDKMLKDMKPGEKEHVSDEKSFDGLLEKVSKSMKDDCDKIMGSVSPELAEGIIKYYEKTARKVIAVFEQLRLNTLKVEGTHYSTWPAHYTAEIRQIRQDPNWKEPSKPGGDSAAHFTKPAYTIYYHDRFGDTDILGEGSYPTSQAAERAIKKDRVTPRHNRWPIESYASYKINLDGKDDIQESAQKAIKLVKENMEEVYLRAQRKEGYTNCSYHVKGFHTAFPGQKERLCAFLNDYKKLSQKLKDAAKKNQDRLVPVYSIDLTKSDMPSDYKKLVEKMRQEAVHRQNLFKKSVKELDEIEKTVKLDDYAGHEVLPRPQKACYPDLSAGFSEKEQERLQLKEYIDYLVYLYPKNRSKSDSILDQLAALKDSFSSLDKLKASLEERVSDLDSTVMAEIGHVEAEQESLKNAVIALEKKIKEIKEYEEDVADKRKELKKMSAKIVTVQDGKLKKIIEASQELVKSIAISSGSVMGYDAVAFPEKEGQEDLKGWNSHNGYFVVAKKEGQTYDALEFLKYKIKTAKYDIDNTYENISVKSDKKEEVKLFEHHYSEKKDRETVWLMAVPADVKMESSALVKLINLAVLESDSKIIKKLPEFISKIEHIRQAGILINNVSILYHTYDEALNEQIESLTHTKMDMQKQIEALELEEELEERKEQQEQSEDIVPEETSTPSETNDESVMEAPKVLIAMLEAYETGDRKGFMRHVSDEFRSNFSTSQNYTLLEQAVTYDFRNLRDIRFNIYFTGKPLYYEENVKIRVAIDWNRRAEISRQGREWLIDNQRTDFIFKKFPDGGIKLVGMQGDEPFGLSNEFGTATITEGRVIEEGGRILPVDEPIEIEYGQVKSSADIRSGSVEEVTVGGLGWSFSAQGEVPDTSSDFYWENNVATYDLSGDAGLLDMTAEFGYTDLDQVIALPVSGYGNYFPGVTPGSVFAVKTRSGKKAAIKITSFTPTRMYFDYMYFE